MGFENGKLVRVTLRAFAAQGQQQVNTFHYDLVTGVPGEDNDPQALADRFRDDVRPHFQALYTPNWSIDSVVVTEEKDPKNANAARSQWSSGAVTVGSSGSAGDPLPHAMCNLARLKTAHIGRRFTGRLFLGGDLKEGDLSSVWTAQMQQRWQQYLDAVPHQPDISSGADPGTFANWVVYSRTQRAQSLNPYASAVNAVLLQNRVHWLRSRDE